MSVFHWEDKTGDSIAGVVSRVLNRGEESLASTGWLRSCLCSRCVLGLVPQEHTAGSCSASCPLDPPAVYEQLFYSHLDPSLSLHMLVLKFLSTYFSSV